MSDTEGKCLQERLALASRCFGGGRVVVEATLSAGSVVTATCRRTTVAVEEGHPASHRW